MNISTHKHRVLYLRSRESGGHTHTSETVRDKDHGVSLFVHGEMLCMGSGGSSAVRALDSVIGR